jgi:ribosomal protein L34E
MTTYRCPVCRPQQLRIARRSDGAFLCARCGDPLEIVPVFRPLRALAGLAVINGVIAATIAALSVGRPFQAQPLPQDRPLRSIDDPGLMVLLDEADESWRPKSQPLPGGGTRYTYKHRKDDPPLTIDQIKLLIRYPPRFDRERSAIAALLAELRSRGVLLVLGPPHKVGAAGEWEPRAGILRIRPDVPSKGSEELAKVINHESIHVAQSCRNGGLRAPPRPLGLPLLSTPAIERFMGSPIYAGLNEMEKRLEWEAYSNQQQLELGVSLVRANCGQR